MRLLSTKLVEHWGHEHLRAGKKTRIPKRSPGRTRQWRGGSGESSVLTEYFRYKVVSCAVERSSKIEADKSVSLLRVVSVWW